MRIEHCSEGVRSMASLNGTLFALLLELFGLMQAQIRRVRLIGKDAKHPIGGDCVFRPIEHGT